MNLGPPPAERDTVPTVPDDAPPAPAWAPAPMSVGDGLDEMARLAQESSRSAERASRLSRSALRWAIAAGVVSLLNLAFQIAVIGHRHGWWSLP